MQEHKQLNALWYMVVYKAAVFVTFGTRLLVQIPLSLLLFPFFSDNPQL